MNRLCVAAALLVVAGCDSEPLIRADSERNFNSSMRRLEKVAEPERIATLDRALQDIILTRELFRDFDGTASFAPAPATFPNSARLRSPLAGWPAVRTKLVVDQIGGMIDNMPTQEILEVAQRQRNRFFSHLSDFAVRTSFMSDMLFQELPPPPPATLSDQEVSALDKLTVTGAVAMTVQHDSGVRRFISFTISNGLDTPIRSISLSANRGDLTSPDEDGSSFNYSFPMALPPNASRRIIVLAPVRKAAPVVQSGSLKLHIVGAVYGDEQRIGVRQSPVVDEKARDRQFKHAIVFGAPGAVHHLTF